MNAKSRTFDVPCTVEIVQTPESLAAHVTLDGYEVGPGDQVTVHDAPGLVPFGEQATFRCRATVIQAGPVERAITKVLAYLELTELYDIGFCAGRA